MEELFTKFSEETYRYLEDKLPEIPAHRIREISENINFATLKLSDELLKIHQDNIRKWWRQKLNEVRNNAKKGE